MKKLFFSALMCFMTLSLSAQYVDLGLPSGTKWKSTNEEGFYTCEQAMEKFGRYVPTKAQWEELLDYCSWVWTGRGCKVTGPNGRSIFLPADGMLYYHRNERQGQGEGGVYYAFTSEPGYGWCMSFEKNGEPEIFYTDDFGRKAFSTRLVQ